MSYREAFNRAVATFFFGVTSAPVPAALFDVAPWKVAAASGLAAVWNLVFRWSQAYVENHK